MKPIHQFIADPLTPSCLRNFLVWAGQGAANDEAPPPVFANWRDCRVRLVTAKANGYVGITASLGHVAPQREVSLNDLTVFLNAPYPARPPAKPVNLAIPITARTDVVLQACCARAGVKQKDLRMRDKMAERCFAVGELYAVNISISVIARAVNVMPTAVNRCLDRLGLRGPDTIERRWVRAIWVSGAKQIGTDPGQIPGHIASRLAGSGLAVITGATCDAALRHRYPTDERKAA